MNTHNTLVVIMTKSSRSITENNESVSTKKTLFQRVGDFLESKGWNYRSITERHYYEMELDLDHCSVRIIFDADDSDDWNRVKVFVIFPVFAPKLRRLAVVEKINSINQVIDCGSFDIDLGGGGEFRYRNTLETIDPISDETLQHQFARSLYCAEVYFEKLMAVAFGSDGESGEKLDDKRPEAATLQ